MSEQELKEFIAAVERVRVANTASPEAARTFLQQEGLLTPEGKLPEQYTTNPASTKTPQ